MFNKVTTVGRVCATEKKEVAAACTTSNHGKIKESGGTQHER